MSQEVISQFEVFGKVVEAMDAGKTANVRQVEKIIKEALLSNKKKRIKEPVFFLSPEELEILRNC